MISMSMMHLTLDQKFQVIKPGIQTSIQDLGRRGYMAYGVGRSGALDQASARIANWLVGNDEDEALLETIHHGLHIKLFHIKPRI